MNAKRTIKYLLIVISLFSFLVQAEMTVSYRIPVSKSSKYHDYYRELLELALEKTKTKWGPYKMVPAPPNNVTLRSLSEAISNNYPNFLIELGFEDKLLDNKSVTYINFPIDGGIYGYRVCFINSAIKKAVAEISNIDDLKKYTIAQGVGWADTGILRFNGFHVIEVSNYESIFKMVAAGRVDLFCRGANQLVFEMEEYQTVKGLDYDKSFVLYYPLPRYFFLNSANTEVKERVFEGLKIAYKDGSMKKLWEENYRKNLDEIKLKNRRVFHLENPFITKLDNTYQQYFFDPMQ